MSDFVPVVKAADLPDSGRQLVELEDRIVVLFHVGGQFYCIDDVCTHDGGPLSEGKLSDYAIACPRHGSISPTSETTFAPPVALIGLASSTGMTGGLRPFAATRKPRSS